MKLIKTCHKCCVYPEFAADGVDVKIGEIVDVNMDRYSIQIVNLLLDRGFEKYEPKNSFEDLPMADLDEVE